MTQQPAAASEFLELRAQASLGELQERYPLPPGWTLEERFMQGLSLGSLTLYMVGLAATDSKQNALGSATQADDFPVDRAYFELLERISIHEAHATEQLFDVRDKHAALLGKRSSARVFPRDVSPRLRTSLSNGVALHATWERACRSALHELIERDRVLRSFAGEIKPVRVQLAPSELTTALREQYESAAYELGQRQPAPRHRTAMLFMTPRQPELPITYGFGTDYTLTDALARAEREAMQRLAFLWDEALPDAPVPATPTPDYHQDFYLYPANHALLHAWLAGERTARHAFDLPLFDGEPVSYIDLTPAALRGKLAVAKAISPSTRRLRFGLPAFPHGALPHPLV